jgi:hypothetical protein
MPLSRFSPARFLQRAALKRQIVKPDARVEITKLAPYAQEHLGKVLVSKTDLLGRERVSSKRPKTDRHGASTGSTNRMATRFLFTVDDMFRDGRYFGPEVEAARDLVITRIGDARLQVVFDADFCRALNVLANAQEVVRPEPVMLPHPDGVAPVPEDIAVTIPEAAPQAPIDPIALASAGAQPTPTKQELQGQEVLLKRRLAALAMAKLGEAKDLQNNQRKIELKAANPDGTEPFEMTITDRRGGFVDVVLAGPSFKFNFRAALEQLHIRGTGLPKAKTVEQLDKPEEFKAAQAALHQLDIGIDRLASAEAVAVH